MILCYMGINTKYDILCRSDLSDKEKRYYVTLFIQDDLNLVQIMSKLIRDDKTGYSLDDLHTIGNKLEYLMDMYGVEKEVS